VLPETRNNAKPQNGTWRSKFAADNGAHENNHAKQDMNGTWRKRFPADKGVHGSGYTRDTAPSETTHPKGDTGSAQAAELIKQEGNRAFESGDYDKAITLYSQAIGERATIRILAGIS
jgi:hypothetical protein